MMTNYIIQVILFQLGFLLVFELFLKKETFFSYNRWYLLFTPIIAIILPFFKIPQLGKTATIKSFQSMGEVWLPEVVINSGERAAVAPEMETAFNPFLMIYVLGMAASLIFFGIKCFKLNRLAKKSRLISDRYIKIYEVKSSTAAFTFFRKIFIGDQLTEAQKTQIMNHERVHIDQNHSADLFYFETLKIFFWFNPLIYIFQSRLVSIHEFIADENAMKKTTRKSYYEQLLNTAFGTQNISFINQFFNHSLIKKRIIMLQKNKSNTLSKFKFLLILPLLMAMLTYVACSEDRDYEKESAKSSLVDEIQQLEAKIASKKNLTADDVSAIESLRRTAAANVELIEVVEEEGSHQLSLEETVLDMANQNREQEQYTNLPFAVVEKAPAFEGCGNITGNSLKECTQEKITLHVQNNFNTGLGKELGLTGINRVLVQFKIDKNGDITEIRARAPKEELKEEAIRVLKLLPKFEPGLQSGKPVNVMYSLPITFRVGE